MNISPYSVKLNTFKISMRKHVNIIHTAISLNCPFGLRYQHQVLRIMGIFTIRILLPYRFLLVNELWNTACKTPLPPKSGFSWFQLCDVSSSVHYCTEGDVQSSNKKKYRWHGMVSRNICPLQNTHFYLNQRIKFKCKNTFVRMVTHFKKNSQWACSMSTLLLTGWWSYFTQSTQCSYDIPQYIATI